MFPLVGNIFPLLGKLVFESQNICVPTNGKYLSSFWKNIFYMQKYVLQVAEIIFPLLGIFLFQAKVCVSSSRKCVSTSGKSSLCGQIYMFPLLEIFLHLSKKQFLQAKIYVSTSRKNVHTTGISFSFFMPRYMFPIVGNIFSLLRIVFTGENMHLNWWK